MRAIFILVILGLISANSYAGYNANFKGEITHVLTYIDTKEILIRVEGQPTTHPTCTQLNYLSISTDDDVIRQQILSRVLMAYASKEQLVNIGYDKEAGCVNGRIKVYRVG